MKINILDKNLANMIAAGEVVERPASAVKELVENSVDANAKKIVVEIKNGGMTYIRVTDDGDGIHPEDAVTAFSRHATSKIKTKEDLEKICTLGFRGEALASIAAVSRVEMFTKIRDSEFGRNVTVEGGEIIENSEAGCPDGTTLIIRNLFFNTPARMKFLKSDAAETTAVTDVINKMILCHPDVSIKLISNGKTVISSHGTGKINDCVHAVYGDEYSKNMIDVDYKEEHISVRGCTGAFSLSRKDRRHQVFFLNGRNIINKTISSAVAEAYRNSVMIGKFPVCVLYIDIAPGLVDVNVHPTKMEVRFSNEKKIYNAVYWAVKEAISVTRHVPEIDDSKVFSLTKEEKKQIRSEIPPQTELTSMEDSVPLEEKTKKNELKEEILSAVIKNAREYAVPQFKNNQSTLRQEPNHSGYTAYKKSTDTLEKGVTDIKTEADTPQAFQKAETERVAAHEQKEIIREKETTPETESFADKAKSYLPNRDFTLIGQVFNTYIIAQSGDDMLLIDQHAAHERIWFEQLMENWQKGEVSMQPLLIPVVISLDGYDFNTARDNVEFFAEIGFEIDIFGSNDIIIRKVPLESDDGVIRETISEIIDILSKNSAKPTYELYEKTLHTVACKKAIKGGKNLTRPEMEHLISKVMELDSINTCPHGRPICIRMSKTSLEKQFKRIV